MTSAIAMPAFKESSLQIRLYLTGEHSRANDYLNSLKSFPLFTELAISKDEDTQVIIVNKTQTTALKDWDSIEEEVFAKATTLLKEYSELGFIGATVIYQAVYRSLDESTDEFAIQELIEARINKDITPFSQEIPGGRLFLLNQPVMQSLGTNNFQPIIRYLAFCETKSEKLLNAYLSNYSYFSRDIAFVKAHQNVHKFRVCSSRDNLQETLDSIDGEIQALFKKNDVLGEETKVSLEGLSKWLSHLLRFYIEANSTATSMVQQKNIYQHSFDAEPSFVAEGQVWHFLRERINTLNEELEIKISECQAVLQATQQAVAMVQTRIDQADEALEREQEKRYRRRDELLAYLGVAIALPELLNYDLVQKILTSWNIDLLPIGYFAIQLLLIVIIGVFIVELIKRSSLRSLK
ncbi:MAG TPA: hypothetical protein DD636_08595 [Anaerolineaceae bacterium]|jgi:hypothetical protein|nr:hypothetical protein [Anaerolineaceae bacterium]